MPSRMECLFVLMVVWIAVSTQQDTNFSEAELADYNKMTLLMEKEGTHPLLKEDLKSDIFKSRFRAVRDYVFAAMDGYKHNKRKFWIRLNQWSAHVSENLLYFGTRWDEEIKDDVEPVDQNYTKTQKFLYNAWLESFGHNFSYHLLDPMPWQINDTIIVPKSIDWRLRGTVFKPRDKYHFNCKASYPFAVAATIDAHFNYYAPYTEHFPTSPQIFLSCPFMNDITYKNYNPCKDYSYGGNGPPDAIVRSYEFAVLNGLRSEDGWPYANGDGNGCLPGSDSWRKGFLDGYVILPSGKKAELDLMIAVGLYGPVTVSFESSEMNFELMKYGGGIFDLPCFKGKMFTMVVIGYGEEKGTPYWLLMNNFGKEWGQYGYIKIARFSKTACDITQQMIFPIVNKEFPRYPVKGNYWTEYVNSVAVKVKLLNRYNYVVGKELPPELKLSNEPGPWI